MGCTRVLSRLVREAVNKLWIICATALVSLTMIAYVLVSLFGDTGAANDFARTFVFPITSALGTLVSLYIARKSQQIEVKVNGNMSRLMDAANVPPTTGESETR